MLAYVFWHRPASGVDVQIYEKNLVAFHEILRAQKPAGFLFSIVFRLPRAPWSDEAGATYEDWYLVENSAVLDVLNETAVTGQRKAPHDRAASNAVGGTAGLYRPHSGTPDLATSQTACWFSKPAGMPYEELYNLLQPTMQRDTAGSLWRRQMTLGPTSEFCWRGSHDPVLPGVLQGSKLALTLLWSGQ
ncbi:MAG TPA: hypothetical protein VHZ51_13175 [Ktedonobacteraceae bacterium]|jgi:hypothetical protein|nr:hypothetical protein [Ktedonobacteraceae bacterium]